MDRRFLYLAPVLVGSGLSRMDDDGPEMGVDRPGTTGIPKSSSIVQGTTRTAYTVTETVRSGPESIVWVDTSTTITLPDAIMPSTVDSDMPSTLVIETSEAPSVTGLFPPSMLAPTSSSTSAVAAATTSSQNLRNSTAKPVPANGSINTISMVLVALFAVITVALL